MGGVESHARTTTAMQSANSAAERLVLVAVPVWVIGQLPTFDPGLSLRPPEAVVAAAVISAFGYAWFLWKSPREAAPLLAALWGATLVLAILGPTAAITAGSYPAVAAWQSLSAICTGALLPNRRGVLTMTGLIFLVGAVLWFGHQPMAQDLGALFGLAAYSLASGMALAAAMSALRGTAQRSDEQARAWAEAESSSAQAEAGEIEQRRVIRLLHDTVVNTLGAVARLPQDPQTVAQRCQADLELLEQVEAHDGDPRAILHSAQVRARLLGVQLHVQEDQLGPHLPPRMADAIHGALWESLNNVAKHAGTGAAELRWNWDGRTGHVSLADSGPGFNAENGWVGGGRGSVADRCAEAGIATSISSAAERGTTVHLSWHEEPAPAVVPARMRLTALNEVTSRVVIGVGMIFAALGAFLVIVMPAGGRRASIPLLMIMSLVIWHADRVRRGETSRVWGLTYPLLVFLAAMLPGSAIAGSSRVDLWWWGPQAALVVTVAAVLLDGRVWVTVSTAGAYLVADLAVAISPSCADACRAESLSLIAVDMAVVAAVIAFRHRLTTTWEVGQQAWAARAAEQQRTAEARAVAAVRTRMLAFAGQVAEPILEGLARGELSSADTEVHARASRAEATLRALAAVPPTAPVGAYDALAGFVAEAHRRDVELRLSLPAGVPEDIDAPRLGNLLQQLLDMAPAGTILQMTILTGAGNGQIIGVLDNKAHMVKADRVAPDWHASAAGSQALLEAELVSA